MINGKTRGVPSNQFGHCILSNLYLHNDQSFENGHLEQNDILTNFSHMKCYITMYMFYFIFYTCNGKGLKLMFKTNYRLMQVKSIADSW